LENLPFKQYLPWNSFSRREFTMAINKCNNLSAPKLITQYNGKADRKSNQWMFLILLNHKQLHSPKLTWGF